MATSIEPSIPRFADAFWDEHHYGVQVINQRLGNAKQTCEEIKKLYHVRSQMEGDYGNRLLKLSQLIVGQDEDGTLAESLSHIPSALETTARAHMDLAQQLQHHLHSPLESFMKEQKDQFTMKHQHISNTIKVKDESNESLIKAKETYMNECARLNEIYQYLQGYAASKDERIQAEADRDACLKSIELAEQEYRQSINNHNDSIRAWVDGWRDTCDMYQLLEEKRIRFVRSSLWAFANMMSSVYIVDDQCCERIRTALELTDVDKDIHAFVEKYSTGKSLPELEEFENRMPLMPPMHTFNATHSDTERQDSIEIKALPTMPSATYYDEEVSSQHNIVSSPSNSLKDQSQQQEPQSAQPQQSEAMAFAAQAIEHMLQDDVEKNKETPISLSEHKLAPQQQQNFNIDETKSSNTPQPVVVQSLVETNRPSSIKSTESGRIRFKPVPNPTFTRASQPSSAPPTLDTKKQPSSDNDNDPQLAELISTAALVAAGTHQDTTDQPSPPPIISTATTNTATTATITTTTTTTKDAIHLTDDESEEEQSPKANVRPPRKDEKWVISSIRRPQMVPVRSTNAHVYDGTTTTTTTTTTPRGSMIRTSVMIDPQQLPEQQEPSPEANVSGKLNRPHPPLKIEIPHKNETKAAAQEAIAAGRTHTQQQQQQQQHQHQHQHQQQHLQNDTVGIRPPPWQQDEQRQPIPYRQPYDSYNQRYSQHMPQQQQQQQQPLQPLQQQPLQQQQQQQQQPLQGGLNRYGSVSGPRVAPDTITAGFESDGKSSGKNNKEFSRFMKGVLKSNNHDRPLSGDMTGKSFDMTPTNSHATKKEKSAGRFSLGIFGGHKKEKEKEKRNRESPQSPPVLISGPPGGGPIYTNTNNSHVKSYPVATLPVMESHSSIPTASYPPPPPPLQMTDPVDKKKSSLTADGSPIMHYARAVWSFTATIPMEMSFAAGDRLAIVKKQADGWWDAELQGPKKSRGLVPGNYMETE